MVNLMIADGTAGVDTPATRTGGTPLTPPGFDWPRCRECTGFMQFLAQVRLDDVEPGAAGLLSIFMCQNDPGLCDEWDPAAGGNRALVFGTDAVRTPAVPDEDVTLLAKAAAVTFVTVESDDYFDARERWAGGTDRSVQEVLGQVGGQPAWLQNDETPVCETCDRRMSFVVQLEEGADHQTSINFGGGGCGYGFRCGACAAAAFLWQR